MNWLWKVWTGAQQEELRYWEDPATVARHRDIEGRIRYWRPFLDLLSPHVRWNRDTRCLDVGCGPTGILLALGEGLCVGVDPLIHEYQKLYSLAPSVCYVGALAERLPLRDECFDCGFCMNALDHCAAPAAVLAECSRALRPGGLLLLATDVYPNPLRKWRAILGLHTRALLFRCRRELHPHKFCQADVKYLLRRFQFEILTTTVIAGRAATELTFVCRRRSEQKPTH